MKRTLFIGLGGCGLQTVSALSKKLAAQKDPNSEYMFLYIDTDEETLDSINHSGTVIRGEDFLGIGEANPYKIYHQATLGDQPEHKRILEWATEPGPGHLAYPNQQLIDGAQAQRMLGRTAFAQFAESKIRPALETRLAKFKELETQDAAAVEADVWVVASSCGGTGSSLTLDILYLINRLVNKSQNQNPYTKLVLFMPHAFIEKNRGNENHPLNGMSFLWELNAFKQRIIDGGKDIFKYFSAYPWEFTGDNYDLCRFVIPVDTETDSNKTIDLKNIYATTAEMIYYLNVGDGARKTVSNLSNDIPIAAKQSTALTQYSDTHFKWGTYLIPYGFHVIRKANPEFREYLKRRAISEILSYGLLGEEMSEAENVRKEAKESFAAEYILPYLYDFKDGMSLHEMSVQRLIEEEFPRFSLRADDLDTGKVNSYLTRVKDVAESTEEIRGKVYPLILSSINKGTCKAVIEHGLRYTYTLLNLVDDYYLETLNSNVFAPAQRDAEEKASAKLATINSLLQKGVKKSTAATIAKAAKEYREESIRILAIKITRNIVNDLTVSQTGYLEVLRKGEGDIPGITGLVDIVGKKAGQARVSYDDLANDFLDTEKDALTVYLPSLTKIAGKEGSGWAKDNEFEKYYHRSILDFDHARARGVNGVRVPVRKNENKNNLCHYLEMMLQGTEPTLFVDLATAPRNAAKSHLDKILDAFVEEKLDAVIDAEGSDTHRWLKQSLEEYISENESDLRQLMSVLSKQDKIPVLYPKKAVATTPTMTRFLYVGASSKLASDFGYAAGETSNMEFVEDTAMTDRFQIIKMPIGLDFYSYKYFDELQHAYLKHREQILSEAKGCHLHKAFRFLDLDRAVKEVKVKENIDALRLFIKNIYYQEMIAEMKASQRDAYDSLFGIFSFPSISEGKASASDGSFDLSQFMGEEAIPTSQIPDPDIQDIFFEYSLKLINPLGMTIKIHPMSADTDGNLSIEWEKEEFELSNIVSPVRFSEALANGSNAAGFRLTNLMRRAEMVEAILKQDRFSSAVLAVKDKVKAKILALGKPNFAALLDTWQKKKTDSDQVYLRAINHLLKNEL